MRRLLPALSLLLALASLAFGGWQWQSARAARQALAAMTPSVIDIRFAQFMSLHHHQAVVLSQMMRGTVSPAVLVLAETIRHEQQLELGEMRGWLRVWGQPHLPEGRSMDWMLLGARPPDEALRQYLLDCQRASTGMPGLASPEELQKLRAASGSERQYWFLELMRRHHEGGLPMARFAAREARLPAVRELAARIVREQGEELMTIRGLQARLDTRPD